jgi:hypothetical protein
MGKKATPKTAMLEHVWINENGAPQATVMIIAQIGFTPESMRGTATPTLVMKS